jgi:hypothetical protein
VVMYEQGKDRLRDTQIEFTLNARKARIPISYTCALDQGIKELNAQKYSPPSPRNLWKEAIDVLKAGYQSQLMEL